jgi:hypothetical protein
MVVSGLVLVAAQCVQRAGLLYAACFMLYLFGSYSLLLIFDDLVSRVAARSWLVARGVDLFDW